MSRGGDDIEHAEQSARAHLIVDADIAAGLKSDSVAGVIDNSATASKEAQNSAFQRAQRQAQRRYDDILFVAMINDLEAAVAAGEAELAEIEQELVDEFGNDWDQDNYEILFGDRGDHLTREERIAAMAAEVLDEDGNVKPQYADSLIGRYLDKEYDVDRMRELINSGQYDVAAVYAQENGMAAVMVGTLQSDDRQLAAVTFNEGENRRQEVLETSATNGGVTDIFAIATAGEQANPNETLDIEQSAEVVVTPNAFDPFA